MEKAIKREFFERKAEVVARDLLGKIIEVKGKKIMITETEAYYDEKDPASRACQKGDLRTTMMMEPGTVLVYGVHNNWLMNIVTGKKGEAEAVLLRAGKTLNFNGKCSGPGLLCKALGIDKSFHKKELKGNILIKDMKNEGFVIQEAKRIGVKKDLEKPLRFYIKGNKFVSRK